MSESQSGSHVPPTCKNRRLWPLPARQPYQELHGMQAATFVRQSDCSSSIHGTKKISNVYIHVELGSPAVSCARKVGFQKKEWSFFDFMSLFGNAHERDSGDNI